MIRFKGVLFVASLLLLLPMAAQADSVNFTGSGGSFSYTLGSNFSASGGPGSITTIFINGTPYTITGGSFSISSGAESGTVGTAGTVGFSANFGAGGTITVSGTIAALGASGTLFSATYSSSSFFHGVASAGVFGGVLNPGTITFHSNILSALNSQNPTSGSNAESLLSLSLTQGSYSGNVGTSGISVTVPEPATLGLLGAGLIGLAGMGGFFRRSNN